MKYENYEAVSCAMKRLKDIKEFEAMLAKDPNGAIEISPPNGGVSDKLKVPGTHQTTHNGSIAMDAFMGRANLGNGEIRRGILNGIKVAKKELCTFLHDMGVDVTELQKELKL